MQRHLQSAPCKEPLDCPKETFWSLCYRPSHFGEGGTIMSLCLNVDPEVPAQHLGMSINS